MARGKAWLSLSRRGGFSRIGRAGDHPWSKAVSPMPVPGHRLPGRLALPLAGAAALALLSACNPLGGAGPTSAGTGTTSAASAAGTGSQGTGTQGTGEVQAFPVPTAGSDLSNIAAGPDGALWFTEQGGNKVGRITTSGQIAEYPIPDNAIGVSDAGPTSIVSSGGAMWFLTDIGEGVYRITTNGQYKAFYNNEVNTAINLAPSSSGGVWLMMSHGDGVGSDGTALVLIDPGGKLTGYPADHPNSIDVIALAPDGSVWYNNEGLSLNSVTESGQQSGDPLSSTSADQVSGIAFAKDGTPWFTEYVPNTLNPDDGIATGGSGAVGDFSGGTAHITPVGSQAPDTGIEPYSLVAGPDGDLWFGFSAVGGGEAGIGRIDPATGQVELASTDPYDPTDIAFGPDGALWFTDRSHNDIVRVPVSDLQFQSAAGG